MMPIHDRMPAILSANDYDEWLDPANADTETLRAMLRPAECGDMIAYPVTRAVNSSRNDSSKRSWNVYEPAFATCHFSTRRLDVLAPAGRNLRR